MRRLQRSRLPRPIPRGWTCASCAPLCDPCLSVDPTPLAERFLAGSCHSPAVAFIEVPDGDGTNFERAFARRPEVFAAWQQLNGAIKATSDLRRYELATLAAARRLRSSYCWLAH